MNKTIKVVFGIVGVIGIAKASCRMGMAYGGGLAYGLVGKELIHVTEDQMMEVAERMEMNSPRKLEDYAFVKGVKEAYKVE